MKIKYTLFSRDPKHGITDMTGQEAGVNTHIKEILLVVSDVVFAVWQTFIHPLQITSALL